VRNDIHFDIIVQVRYVLDTCVVVSALRSRNGASNRVLRLAFERKIRAVCHYKLLSEYREVLFRVVKSRELNKSTGERIGCCTLPTRRGHGFAKRNYGLESLLPAVTLSPRRQFGPASKELGGDLPH